MKRQRRMEAIARQRAYIDSQIQLLTMAETRVPNIIRSRTAAGRAQAAALRQKLLIHDPLPPPSRPATEKCYPENSRNKPFGANPPLNATTDLKPIVSVPENGLIERDSHGNPDQPESSYSNEKKHARPETETSVPINIPEELMLFLGGALNNRDKPLQTVQTDDGTVMVVLEGNNLLECGTRESQGEETDVKYDSSSISTPSEDASFNGNEATYVIVQTDNGELLVRKSELPSQVANKETSKSEETDDSVMHFINGKVETHNDLSNSRKDDVQPVYQTMKMPAQAMKLTKQSNPIMPGSSNGVLRKAIGKKPNTVTKKLGKKSLSSSKQKLKSKVVPVQTLLMPPSSHEIERNFVDEKPRPFRFELSESEEDGLNSMCETFMSVPVPIKIDSLRSENQKDEELEKVEFHGSQSRQRHVLPQDVPGNAQFEDTDISTGEHQALCQNCGTVFSDEQSLQIHVNCGPCDSSVQCCDCLEMFSGETAFITHLPICSANGAMTIFYTDEFVENDVNQETTNVIIKSVDSLSSSSKHDDSSIVGEDQPLLHLSSRLSIPQEGACSSIPEATSVSVQDIFNDPTDLASPGTLNIIAEDDSKMFLQLSKPSCVEVELGRRTLQKASARASMSSDNLSSYQVDGNGNTVNTSVPSIQSSKNDKIRLLDKSATTEDELKGNFLSIFKQVAKSGAYSNINQSGKI